MVVRSNYVLIYTEDARTVTILRVCTQRSSGLRRKNEDKAMTESDPERLLSSGTKRQVFTFGAL
jgi:hypothetical protein